MATYADPNGNGTATGWTNTWTNVDEGTRQPAAPGADIIGGTTTDETAETLTFTDPAYVADATYTLWVYGTGGAKRAVDVAYSFDGSDPGLAHATRAQLIPANGAAGWYSRVLTAPANQTELNNLRVEFIANSTAGGGGASAPSVSAVYVEVVPQAVTGSGSSGLPTLGQDAAGAASVTGGADGSLPTLAQDATGTVTADAVTGEGANAVPALSQDATGALALAGSGAGLVSTFTQDAEGTATVSGSAAQGLPELAQASIGAVETDAIAGSAAQTLPVLGHDASGTLASRGGVDQGLPSLGQTSTGSLHATGTSAVVLAALLQEADGSASEYVAGGAVQALPTLFQVSGGLVTVEYGGPSLRLILYRQLLMAAQMGAQIGIKSDQVVALKKGGPVTITREQLRQFSHPSIPSNVEDHESWLLTDSDTLTP